MCSYTSVILKLYLACNECSIARFYLLFLQMAFLAQIKILRNKGASLVAQTVENLPAMQETQIQFLAWK